jgi:hypothetical protein
MKVSNTGLSWATIPVIIAAIIGIIWPRNARMLL